MPPSFHPQLILASNSPRRRELLLEAGIPFDVVAPDPTSESTQRPGESAESLVVRLAAEKAEQVAKRLASNEAAALAEFTSPNDQTLILAADTVAECNGEILGKPVDRDDARRILQRLRGNIHRVLTGVCLRRVATGSIRCAVDITTLEMSRLTDQQIEDYLNSGLWKGKAGAFGYQDGIDWVRILSGSSSNVVGLPMELVTNMLNEFKQGK